jgi:prophage regulatory protein
MEPLFIASIVRFQSAAIESGWSNAMKTEPNTYTRTIRRHQLKEMVPLADSTIFEMEQRGEFPRRYALSPRTVVWDLAEVEAWLAERKAKPIRRGQHVDVHDRLTRPVRGSDRARGAASRAG